MSDQLDTNFLSQWAFLDWMRSYHIVLVFDPKILKDLPFSVCDWMNYGECIDPGISKKKRNKHLILHSKGKRSSIPDMTPLVKHINKMISEIAEKEDDEEEDEEKQLSTYHKWNDTVSHIVKDKNLNVDKKVKTISPPTYYEFVTSHEVIFDYIPLKYIKAIVIHDIQYKKVIQFYLPKIPIVVMPYPKPDQKDTDYIKKTVFPILKRIAKM